MYDLHKPFTSPFDDSAIGIDNLVSFTSDFLAKANDNNTGGFLTQRIAATTAAFGTVNTAFQLDLSKLGIRKSSKKDKKAFRKTISAGLSDIFLILQTHYGRTASALDLFFPKGLSAMSKTRDDQMGNDLTMLVQALTTHSAEVGAQVVTDATALKNGWLTVYSPSETSTADKAATMGAKRAARAALQLELYKCWLTIALQFPRQPAMLDVYMQQSLLSPHNPAPGTPTPPTPPTP